ncbi:MAG: class I SAM-dependent methyltransferase [Nitrospirota bacterium]
MPIETKGADKAGKQYWENTWAEGELPKAVNQFQSGLNDYVTLCFHRYFRGIFSKIETQGMKLLEIGCARSVWLPYFAKEFGFVVNGLDYSEKGCSLTRQILNNEGVKGEVVCVDFFSPPKYMLGGFDVVVSFGVAEHFQGTAECLSAFSKLLKDGGIIITIVPNMTGLIGYVQRIMNRPVYDIHVPLDRELLYAAHKQSGLDVIECDYFLSTNFGVINLDGISQKTLGTKKEILRILVGLSKAIWLFEMRLGHLAVSKCMSPYIKCLSRKPKGHHYL